MWTHRILLETLMHKQSCFVTLTYDDEHVPKDGSLVPADYKNWLKKFRKAVYPSKVRYFLVGEYGENNARPHFHLALFGFPGCYRGRTDHRLSNCCPSCTIIKKTWGNGSVDIGELNAKSAAYVGGYVTKKFNVPDAEYEAFGLIPEFARMSLKPGIGADAMVEVARVLKKSLVDEIPTVLRHEGKKLPLGRYLRGKIREFLNIKKPEISHEYFNYYSEIRAILSESLGLPENRNKNIKQILVDKFSQEVLNFEGKFKIHDGGRKL